MTIHWKVFEQYVTVELFAFQFCPVYNFLKFISFGHGTVRSERMNVFILPCTVHSLHTSLSVDDDAFIQDTFYLNTAM